MTKTWPQRWSPLPSTSRLQEMQERCTALHCPMSQGGRPLHPAHRTGRISPCQDGERWHWDPAGVGDLLAQLALPHQRGGPGGEGLQGLSWPMVALGCCEGTAPVPFPPVCPSLHCCKNSTPSPGVPSQPQESPSCPCTTAGRAGTRETAPALVTPRLARLGESSQQGMTQAPPSISTRRAGQAWRETAPRTANSLRTTVLSLV